MALIEWGPGLSVGIESFDQDHHRLVQLINQLHEALKVGHGMNRLLPTFLELQSYTAVHFAREEAAMAATAFAGLAAHRTEHRQLTARVLDLKAQFDAGSSVAITLEVMVFLRDWVTHHICVTDKAYSPHLKARGVR